MISLLAQARKLGEWRIPAIWSVVPAVVALAAIAACAWHWRPRTPENPLAMTMSRLAALDAGLQQKVCAHRSNNVPKYRAAGRIFYCIEIDVVLNPPAGGPVAVYHPPVENNHGLSLEFLLTNEGLPRGKLWLDVKDLSGENWASFLELLSRLVPAARRGDVIVETDWSDPLVHPVAAAFRKSGFLVSYYLPTDEASACGADMSAPCEDLRRRVMQTVSMSFSHLSFDAKNRLFVSTLRSRLPPSVRLLTWDLSRSWDEADLIREVDVYIVGFPSPYTT